MGMCRKDGRKSVSNTVFNLNSEKGSSFRRLITSLTNPSTF
jgi:hypothetical protein